MPDSPADRDPDRDDEQPNPFAGTPFEHLFAAGGPAGSTPFDPQSLQMMFGQLQQMFAPHEGSVNWAYTKDLARKVVAQSSDPSPSGADRARVQDAARLAQHWLDGVTEFPSTSSTAHAWSRAEWVEASMPVWQRLVEPIAASVVDAMGSALPDEAKAMAGPLMGMLNQVGGAVFSQQVGTAVGGLSGEVLSSTDIGIPVVEDGTPAIVMSNAAEFADGLSVGDDDVLLFLVLRECAHQRLFAAAPWLREHLFRAIEDYGRGITVDPQAIEGKLGSIDPSNLEEMQQALEGGLFDPEPSPAQRHALERIETTLALIEGWVDEVVNQATAAMPSRQALQEAVRRRRATGGPAEATFASLIGLELRPRRLRDAAALWGAVRDAHGAAARDAAWGHPDMLPTTAELDDPLAFAQRTAEADAVDVLSPEFDAELAKLLDEGAGGGRSEGDATDQGSADDGEPGATEDDDETGGTPGRDDDA